MTKKQKPEFTWISKENRPKLEPRILLEDPLMSDHAKHRVTDNDIFDNKLIFGDNLLALQDVGATKSPGAILNASPEGVRHMDMPNNSFAHWWQHDYSTERDFIHITTASLTHEQLQQLGDEVGPERSLLVLCTAFRARAEYLNLTVKKIPKQVLSRCEWGHDDDSLQVENLPQAPVELGQQDLFDSREDAKARK